MKVDESAAILPLYLDDDQQKLLLRFLKGTDWEGDIRDRSPDGLVRRRYTVDELDTLWGMLSQMQDLPRLRRRDREMLETIQWSVASSMDSLYDV